MVGFCEASAAPCFTMVEEPRPERWTPLTREAGTLLTREAGAPCSAGWHHLLKIQQPRRVHRTARQTQAGSAGHE